MGSGTERLPWPRRLAARYGWAIGLWALGTGVFYRATVRSGFARVQIYGGDSDIGTYTLEHWNRWVGGSVGWKSPDFFYPVKGVLGYSDALGLYAPIYVLLRRLGADFFLAQQLTVMAVVSIGFVSLVVLLQRHLRVHPALAAVAGAAFAFANSLTVKQIHVATVGVAFVPLFLLLGAESLRAIGACRGGRSALWAGACGLVWALLFFTSYYMAWFFTLSVVALGVVAVGAMVVGGRLSWRGMGPRARDLWAGHRQWWPAAAGLAAGLAVGIVPFLVVYLPVVASSGGRPWTEVLALLPRPSDVFNLGLHNALWGRRTWPGTDELASLERGLAPTPMLVISALGAVAFLWTGWGREVSPRGRRLGLTLLLVSAGCLTVASWRVGDRSAWRLIWQVVPGGAAIRAVARLQIVLAVGYVIVWACALSDLLIWARRHRGARRAAVSALVVLVSLVVLAEQVNTSPVAAYPHAERAAQIAGVSRPPRVCRAFAVVDSSGQRLDDQMQMDAALMSAQLDMPTVNGLSGNMPAGWNLWSPHDPAYRGAVQDWAQGNGLGDSVCFLDLATGTWSR